jgi:paraquat-inducible protein B
VGRSNAEARVSGSDPSGPVPENPPPPEPSQWAGLPWIWAVPIVALLIAGWLGYRELIERGPTATISFQTADGIEADRTTVRYKNVELGRVVKVGLNLDHSRAIVTARMTREAEPLLRADTTFWVVRPRIGLSGISGLMTVLSGPYIGCCPGRGRAASALLPASRPHRQRKGWSAVRPIP